MIAGPRTEEQWDDYLRALDYHFTAEDEALIDRLVVSGHPSTPGFNDRPIRSRDEGLKQRGKSRIRTGDPEAGFQEIVMRKLLVAALLLAACSIPAQAAHKISKKPVHPACIPRVMPPPR